MVLGGAAFLGGCSSTTGASTEQAATTVEDTRPCIGTEADGSLDVIITNGLGADVTALSVKASTDEAYPVSMIASGVSYAAGEEDHLYYAPASTDTSVTYDLSLTLADGTVDTFEAVPLAQVASMTFLTDADTGVAYVDYEATDGTSASTKDAAVAKKQAADAAAAQAQADAEAQAAAESQAAADAQAEADAEAEQAAQAAKSKSSSGSSSSSSSGSKSTGSSSSGSSSSGSSSSAPSQSEDQCAPDVVLK
jgi:colicin import membrane protein